MNHKTAWLMLGLLAGGRAMAEGSLQVGGAFVPPLGDLTGSVGVVEYEHAIADTVALAGRAMKLGYFYDDDVYEEDGDGSMIGLAARWFPDRVGRGLYIGGGLSSFSSTWDWIDDKGTRYRSSGSGTTKGLAANGEIGYRFALSPTITLTPAMMVGGWLNATQTCRSSNGATCGNDSQIGFFVLGSLMLGVRF
jgi:hypothetical protein